MQTTEYDIVTEDEFTSKMGWKKITASGSEITIHYNNFLVSVLITMNTRNFGSTPSWTQIGTMNVGSTYAPSGDVYSISAYEPRLRFRIHSSGQVQFSNGTGQSYTTPAIQFRVTYPRKSALP